MLTCEEKQWYKVGWVGDEGDEQQRTGKKLCRLKFSVDTVNGFEYSPPSEHGNTATKKRTAVLVFEN